MAIPGLCVGSALRCNLVAVAAFQLQTGFTESTKTKQKAAAAVVVLVLLRLYCC